MSNAYQIDVSIKSGSVNYTVENGSLVQCFAKTGERAAIPLQDVTVVRLTYVQRQALCTVESRDGTRIVFTSRHYKGFGDFEERTAEYRAFLTLFHKELLSSGANPKLIAGSNLIFGLGVVSVFVAVALVILVVGMGLFSNRGFPRHLVKFAFIILALVGVGLPMLLKGKAGTYALDALPEKFLP